MRNTGRGIRVGMIGDGQPVQLADHRHGRPRAAEIEVGAHTGDREALARLQAEQPQPIGDEGRRAHLAEADLRVRPDLVRHVENPRPGRIHGGQDVGGQ
jgi:hypothetical protein